ncbi:MAG: hypothetical protein IJ639_12095 [Ruminococcus sp.]|nr:hypothetical protein [Ruminococcus sp.]
MKRRIFTVIKLLCLILAVALTVGLLQEYVFCHADHNRQRLKGFYEEDKNSLDIVYLGASEVYSDIAPGYAYENGGVTSYLFATQANSILNYKSQLKNILSRQDPDLIVIELNGAVYGDEHEATKEPNLRNYADNVPLDLNKAEWIMQNTGDQAIEYLFPFIKYHGIWSDTRHNKEQVYKKTIIQDQIRGYNYLKGILNETNIFQNTQRSMNDSLPDSANVKEPLTEVEENGLRDLLQFCKDEKLDNVVFARFPHIVVRRTFDRFARSNTVGEIVEEYGFDYLNFERDIALTKLDERHDFYNLDHLNVYGQKKFTAFLTDYLKQHYSVSPRELSDSQQAEWETCADYYEAYYNYSDKLIKQGKRRELSEDCELIERLKDYLPDN